MNNRMLTIAGIAASVGTVIALLAGTFGLRLSTGALTFFCAAIAALSAASAAIVVWMREGKQAVTGSGSAGAAPSVGTSLDELISEAETRLRSAGGALASRPALIVIGPKDSAKTSILVNCGITPKLVAGQIKSEDKIVSTQGANFMLLRETVVADVSSPVLEDAAAWKKLISRFRQGVRNEAPAARSFLLCVPCDDLIAGSNRTDRLADLWSQRVNEACDILGTGAPIYVLFTRGDQIVHFADYVSAFTKPEATEQVLGASFAVPPAHGTQGPHADEAERRFGGAFDTLYASLAAARLEQLPRSEALGKRTTVYEFPREFRKLRTATVRLLTILDRPVRIGTAPFVRGFYFCGVRPVFLDEGLDPPQTAPPPSPSAQRADATAMFQNPLSAAAPKPTPSSRIVRRRVPEWLFVWPLFDKVLLVDPAAQGRSVLINRRGRMMYACLTGLAAVCAVLITISLWANSRLFGVPEQNANGVATGEPRAATVQLASVEQLRELDKLRAELVQLSQWRDSGHPLHMNWGLYAGPSVYSPALDIYFRRFEQLLAGQIRAKNETRLKSLPLSRRETDEYPPAYDALRAYLVMSTEHRRPASDWQTGWLSGWLGSEWNRYHPSASSEQRELAQKQFDFYSVRLREHNPFAASQDQAAVRTARAHLSSFSDIDRLYNSLRNQAAAASEPIRFAAAFPDAAAFVTNTYVVDGAWTARGWAAMNKLLRESRFGGEEWVLGSRALPVQNPEKLKADILDAYRKDYIVQWTQYLRRTFVVPYKGPADAASKLMVLSRANTSPLLAALWLASQHTAVDDQIKREFGAVHGVVPYAPDGSRNFVTAVSQQYAAVLSNLAAAIEAFASGAIPDQSVAAAQMKLKASEARSAVANLSGILPRGISDAAARGVAVVLEQPVTQFDVPDPGKAAAAALNGQGKALCADWSAIASKYPLNQKADAEITLAELASFFGRPGGRIAKMETALASVLQFNGTSWVAAPNAQAPVNPSFLNFFDAASKTSRALYPNDGMTQPQLRFTLGWPGSRQISSMTVDLDGQPVTFQGNSRESKTFTWTGAPNSQVRLHYVLSGGSPLHKELNPSTWALFRFFDDAKKSVQSGAGVQLQWTLSDSAIAKTVDSEGKEVTYSFTVEPAYMTREWLSRLRCVPQVSAK